MNFDFEISRVGCRGLVFFTHFVVKSEDAMESEAKANGNL